jgi:hypothetical protein
MKTSVWFRAAPVVMVLATATASAQDSSTTRGAETPVSVTTPAEGSSTSPLVQHTSCGLYNYGRNGSPAHGGFNADGYR